MELLTIIRVIKNVLKKLEDAGELERPDDPDGTTIDEIQKDIEQLIEMDQQEQARAVLEDYLRDRFNINDPDAWINRVHATPGNNNTPSGGISP